MPKDEWGVKHICPSCSNRFYDLRHDPMTCPTCGASFTVDSLTATKPKAVRPEKVKPAPANVEDLPDVEADDDDTTESGDEILEDEEDNVDLEELADVASDEEES